MMSAATRTQVEAFFDRTSCAVTYVVVEPDGHRCAVIDPVLDFDSRSGIVALDSLQRVVAWVRERSLNVQWILETHPHGDHLSGAFQLKQMLGGRIGIGRGITAVRRTMRDMFNLGIDFPCDGTHFDHLFDDGDALALGGMTGRVLATPGHTPACVTYVFDDAAFAGDTLFMPDVGSARCNFPGGDAATLYRSIRRVLSLPPNTRLFTGHDYAPGSRTTAWESTVTLQRARNIHVNDGVGEAEFVALRTARDKTLAAPALMLPALQVNIRGGRLPPPESNGVSYLKLPIQLNRTAKVNA